MRMVIDLQGAQTGSRFQGRGRYALSLAKAIARNRGRHEILLALSGLFPDTIIPLRAAFHDLVPRQNIRVWYAPGGIRGADPGNEWRRDVAERIREAFLAHLRPDVVFIPSFFEGYNDDGVTSIGQFAASLATVVAVDDLGVEHADPAATSENIFVARKLDHLKRANLLLARSPAIAGEIRRRLAVPPERIIHGFFTGNLEPERQDLSAEARHVISSLADLTSKTYPPRHVPPKIRPKLAYIAQRTLGRCGTIDAHAELLPELSRYYDIDLIVDQQEGTAPRIVDYCGLRSVAAFIQDAHRYHRVLYHFGNSSHYKNLFNLLARVPGVVVLEDFCLGNLHCSREADHFPPPAFTKAVYESHGYHAAARGSCASADERSSAISANFAVLQLSQGIIVHSEDSRNPAAKHYGEELAADVKVIPLLAAHSLSACARHYTEAIEQFHARAQSDSRALIASIAELDSHAPDDRECLVIAEAIARTLPCSMPARQMLVDVSATCRYDHKTGIQRVVRALVWELIHAPPPGYRVEPVYLTQEGGVWHYRHARDWTSNALGIPGGWSADDPVAFGPGDRMLVADFTAGYVVEGERAGVFRQLKQDGIELHFVIYDLLPLLMPQCFPPERFNFEEWVAAVCRIADGALCISRTVAEDLRSWMDAHCPQRQVPMTIGWFHLGADVKNSIPTRGLPGNAVQLLSRLYAAPSFLMVGTIDSRKGHLQTLEAFTRLWQDGLDVNLVIVGGEGWQGWPAGLRRNVPETVDRLNRHPECGKRLFWLEGISDEYLARIYDASTCLLAASEGEGFGLPLIEAAHNKLPIIARDIPIFREVAGEHASYFEGTAAGDLAAALQAWLKLYHQGKHPKSDAMPSLTWKQSARQLLRSMFKNQESDVGP